MDGLVQNIVCLDSSNCDQMKAFFHSSWEIPPSCFLFSLYCFQGAFHSVGNCTCSLLFFSIFHFFFTTFVQRPFSAKTIQGSLHLICIIRCRNEQDGRGILRLCKDLLIQQAWLPCLQRYTSFLCCSIMW